MSIVSKTSGGATSPVRKADGQIVVVFQGGGASGAYQAGAIQAGNRPSG